MQFRVLGPVEVADADRRLTLRSAHQRLMLVVLFAARDRALSADRLIDAVWGEEPPVSARKSLHSHVSRLRRSLGADGAELLVTEEGGYRLHLDDQDLDARRFEDAVAQARVVRGTDPRAAVRHLDVGLALWRGVAFGEHATHPLVRSEAVRLDELRRAAITDRVEVRLELGEYREVVAELEAIVVDEPLAEIAHRQLMYALYRAGRQADALTLYRHLYQALDEHLGVAPAPETQHLHERILRHDPALGRSRRRTGVPDADDPRPSRSAAGSGEGRRLVGRDDEVAALTRVVAAASLVTLTGPGGVGKSVLAEEVAAIAGDGFADGVVTCGLAAVRDPGSVITALAEALGIQQRGAGAVEDRVIAAIGTRQVLLLLDNCEHLLSDVVPVVARLGERCPNLAVLATSREHLRLPGEVVREVRPLPVPPSGAEADAVAATPAGALFDTRARQVEPSFELTDEIAPTIAQVCRRLDGVPLALELAAARVRALSPEALAERIDRRFDLLTGGSRREGGRHRSLAAMVGWSHELLTDTERALFDRLSVFAGLFSLTAAEAVGGIAPLAHHEVAGLLGELVDKSLVTVERDGRVVRYRLLETLRAYGAERLEETEGSALIRRAHAEYHLDVVERLAPRVRGPDEPEALAQIDALLDDLRVAHAWAVEEGEVDAALRLPAALDDDLVFRPRVEVFAWAERAVSLPGAEQHPAYPSALAVVARGALNAGELDRARGLATAALDHAAPTDDATLSASYVLTTVALVEGNLDDALALADRRLALAAELGRDVDRAFAGVSRVLALRYLGEEGAAVLAAEQAREAAEASGNRTATAWALYSHGEALLDSQPAHAAELLEAAVAVARRADRRFIEGVALVSLASQCGRHGEPARALGLFRNTLAHWRGLGVYTQQLTTLRNLVPLLADLGQERPAAVLHGAVTAGATPSFGEEAERLAAARVTIERRLGSGATATLQAQGQAASATEIVDEALTCLDALLGRTADGGGGA